MADIDMDVDFDFDTALDDGETQTLSVPTVNLQEGSEQQETQMEADVLPNKVHLYLAVDSLDSATVKRIVVEHDALRSFSHIEWVNDLEVNLVYENEEAAIQALYALTAPSVALPEEIPLLEERTAKPFSSVPGVEMRVRMSRSTDVKKRGAADESRYYLLNPEKDPRERQRRRELAAKRRRDWDGEADTYTRKHFDDRENKRRRGDERWQESMYDEEADGGEMEEDNYGSRRARPRVSKNQGVELFVRSGRDDGRLRGRSASPPRDGDGRYGFGTADDDMVAVRRRARQRSATPPRLRTSGRNTNAGKELFGYPLERDRQRETPRNAGKELFDTNLRRTSGKELFATAHRPLANANRNSGRELFGPPLSSASSNPKPGKGLLDAPNPNAGKELFGGGFARPASSFSGDDLSVAGAALRRRGSNHRRTDAIDASPRMGNGGGGDGLSPDLRPRSRFEDRITGGSGRQPLSARITRDGDGGGLEARITRDDEDMGMSVRGAAARREKDNPNAGKELFAKESGRRSMLSS